MTPHQNLLKNYQNFQKPRTIRGADKGTFDALGIGDLKLTTRVEGKTIDIHLKDTLYVLGQPKQQVDVTQAGDGDIQSEFIDRQLSKGSHLMMGISKEKSLRTHHQ